MTWKFFMDFYSSLPLLKKSLRYRTRSFSFFDTFGSVQKVHGRGNSHEHFFEKKNRNYIYRVSFVFTSRMVSDFIDRAFFFFCRKKTFSNGQKGLSSLWSTVF